MEASKSIEVPSRTGAGARAGVRAVECASVGASVPKKAGLDNTTKSASPRDLINHDTGEVFTEFDPTLKWQLQALSRVALPGHRVQICMRHVRADRNEVQVKQSLESLRTYYANLMACGSVWACPVCAPKIQHIRSLEVRAAIDHWTDQGGAVVMPTQTTQHNHLDKLSVLLEAFTLALRHSKSGKSYQKLKKRLGIAHSIRALELTHGRHGWHPHAHTILFLEDKTDLDRLAGEMFPLWQSATRRAGLREPSRQAFSVVDASEVKTYVTKMGQEYQWSAEHELVKAHSKSGKGGMSPFDMLRANLDQSQPATLARFAEFAHTFHGKRQLVWSNGSKVELLGTEGLSDQQISDSLGECDPVLAYINLDQWRMIRQHNLQGQVLQVVEKFGKEGLKHMLLEYSDRI